MITAAAIAAACGFLYSPPPIYDTMPLPPQARIVEVPIRDLDTLCAAIPKPRGKPRYGCTIGYTAYVPTWATWPGSRECWIENNQRHEPAHLKGWTHP